MSKVYPAIPEPRPDLQSLYETVISLKQLTEQLTGQRGPRVTSQVTWQDLVDLGLIESDKVPRR